MLDRITRAYDYISTDKGEIEDIIEELDEVITALAEDIADEESQEP